MVGGIIERYRPGAIVLQCGADSLAGDRLGCFNLSHRGHAACVEFVRRFNLPTLILGGGGYTIRNVARCWALETATILHQQLSPDLPFSEYFEYYGPDYRLDVPAFQNMPNLNTPEYLHQCTSTILENLRHVTFAPSVQMSQTPRDLFMASSDEEEEDQMCDPFDLWALRRKSDEEAGHTKQQAMMAATASAEGITLMSH